MGWNGETPGGFSPIGRFPSTRSGEVSVTSGIAFRKNRKPYRWSGGVYYTYSAPGLKNSQGEATYSGDLINARLIFEHILNDKNGFGYSLEFVTLHGVTHRIDGHNINAGQRSGFSVIGVEPSSNGESLIRISCARPAYSSQLAGQNATNSVYPNLSIFYYWSKSGKVQMR